ncbi:hypothetical protein AYI68_g3183 [Smittium mucronatum]|uniref:Uncharacterized protein n=1 Tax=Smittium mucronatum TaxID=133383 RepID=A0A1R0H0N6_9FUNG|nr:hypothetical protein AYI68_g3183 [Smittium mucronatum]
MASLIDTISSGFCELESHGTFGSQHNKIGLGYKNIQNRNSHLKTNQLAKKVLEPINKYKYSFINSDKSDPYCDSESDNSSTDIELPFSSFEELQRVQFTDYDLKSTIGPKATKNKRFSVSKPKPRGVLSTKPFGIKRSYTDSKHQVRRKSLSYNCETSSFSLLDELHSLFKDSILFKNMVVNDVKSLFKRAKKPRIPFDDNFLEVEANINSYPFLSKLIYYGTKKFNVHREIYSGNNIAITILLSAAFLFSSFFWVFVSKVVEDELQFVYFFAVSGFSMIMSSVFVEIFTNRYGLFNRTGSSPDLKPILIHSAWAVFNSVLQSQSLASGPSLITFQHYKSFSLIVFLALSQSMAGVKRPRSEWVSGYLILIGGLLISTFIHFQSNNTPLICFKGGFLSICSVLSTTFFLISFNRMVTNSKVGSMTFLRFYFPVCGLGYILSLPFSGSISGLLNYEFSYPPFFAVLGLSAIGACVNISFSQLLITSGPSTIYVVFQLNACILLVFGYFYYGLHMTLVNFAGVFVCLIGILVWSYRFRLEPSDDNIPHYNHKQ